MHWVRKTRWNFIHKHYPAERSQYVETKFKYGKANIGGKFRWNSVFSAIEKNGIFLRKPFPFSLFMPPIFIPWDDVDYITVVDDIEYRKSAKSKIVKRLNPFKYVDINLSKIDNVPIVVPWKDAYKKSVPATILR